MEAVEEEVQRMAVEVVEGVQEEGEVLKHRQGLMVGGGGGGAGGPKTWPCGAGVSAG